MTVAAAFDVESFGRPRGLSDLLAHPKIALYGASAAAGEIVALLGAHGRTAECLFDSNPARAGSVVAGLSVRPGADAPAFAAAGGAIVVAAAWQVEIATQLVGAGVARAHVFPFVSAMFASGFGADGVLPQLRAVARLCERVADAESRAYLEALMRFRWTMDPMNLARNPKLKGFYDYDAPGTAPAPGATVIDCGAYTGDTAEVFLKRMNGLGRILAVEPMPQNAARLRAWIAANAAGSQVTAIEAAVGASPGRMRIDGGAGDPDPRAHASGAGVEVEVDTIDRIAGASQIGYLKIDIEGGELAALDGAAATIRRCRPALAIAGYHKPDHVWRIPEKLDDIAPGYRIYAGHHPSAPFEVEFFCAPN